MPTKIDLTTYARLGAETRLRQLDEERAAILAAFPDLGRTSRTRAGRGAADTPKARKRRKMTAAQKKAVSVRMRRYWAKRRAEKAEK